MHEIVLWDRELLSESVTLSLLALFTSGWFLWIHRPTRGHAGLLCTTGWLWGWTKDTNAWVLAILGLACLLAAIWAESRRAHLGVLAATFLTAFLLVGHTSDRTVALANALAREPCTTARTQMALGAPRWAFSLTNVIGSRIVPNPKYRAWFAARGMPDDPVTREFLQRWVDDDEFRSCPPADFEPMQNWVRTEGKRVYVRFLVFHPTWLLEAPLADGNSLFAASTAFAGEALREHGFRTILPSSIENILFARTIAHTAGLGMLVLLGVSLACAMMSRSSCWLTPLGLVVLAWPHALVVWHGDSMEVSRHALQMNVHLRLGTWVLALLVLDAIVARRTGNARSE